MSRSHRFWMAFSIVIAVFSGTPVAQSAAYRESTSWAWLQGDPSEAARFYDEGRRALDRGDWSAAIQAFEKASKEDEGRADAALYWIAYARNKQGDAALALETIDELEEKFPESRWIKDARALSLEIRGSSKRTAEGEDEDLELKLMALNSLMHVDENEAVPLLEEFLRGDHPAKLKERALFVLAQSGSKRGFEVLAQMARNDAQPELQAKAIQYLGIHGNAESMDLLAELYAGLGNRNTKEAVLHSFMISGERERLLEVAKNEKDVELRGDAIHWLGVMDAENALWELFQNEGSIEVKEKILHALFIGNGHDRLLTVAQDRSQPEKLREQAIHWLGVSDATEELWKLYQEEPSVEIKKQILHGMFVSDETDKLAGIARNISEPVELREAAIHSLGVSGPGARPVLLEIYRGEPNRGIREQVLHALFVQEADQELIDIARTESDTELRKQAFHWLSIMDSAEAKKFMLEILKK